MPCQEGKRDTDKNKDTVGMLCAKDELRPTEKN
jgi:hypothetical protein